MNIKKLSSILIITSVVGMSISSVFLFLIINSYSGSWVYELTTNIEETWSSCAISGDGKYSVVGSGNDHIYVFESSNARVLWNLRMDDPVGFVDISQDGEYVLAGAGNNLYLFGRSNSDPIWTYSSDYTVITGAISGAISGDGNYILMTDGFSDRIFLFERTSNIPLWNKTSAGQSFDLSYDGNKIISINNGILNVFNKSSTIPEWHYDTGEIYTRVIISPNGNIIASGGQDNRIRIYNITGPLPIQTYITGGSVRDLSSSQDGTLIVAGCSDGFYLYDISNSTQLWTYPTDVDGYCIDISADGNFIVGSGVKWDVGYDYVYYFRSTDNIPIWTKQVVHYSNKVSISADGSYITAVTGFNFYLINSINPSIDEFYEVKFTICSIPLYIFISIGLLIGLIQIFKWRLRISKEKERFEKEKVEKEILGAIDSLDGKYEEWNKEEN